MHITIPANQEIGSSSYKVRTILLADDDEFVRDLTKTVLIMEGYEVIDAVNGNDAILKYELFRDRIDLVVLDVIMPGKNGFETYKAISMLSPNIKVIFISGYTNDYVLRQGITSSGLTLISKPFSPKELLQQIRQVLCMVDPRLPFQ